ncbi:MAG: MnmC family methyltransferase [Planctomycetota bacterium]
MSYRHPETGEWAHNLSVTPSEDSWKTYLEPAWGDLGRFPHVPLKVVEVGFGRGYNCGTLMREVARTWPQRSLEITAFEPYPERLQPWATCPTDLEDWMPWWDGLPSEETAAWRGQTHPWQMELHLREAQDAPVWADLEDVDLFLLDLFSPNRHPDGWRDPLFEHIAAVRSSRAVLTTFTCARSIRERLTATGWQVQKLRRPGWRDTLVAHFDATPGLGNG